MNEKAVKKDKISPLELIAVGSASFIMGSISAALNIDSSFFAGGVSGAIVAANHNHKTGKFFDDLYTLNNGKRLCLSGACYGTGYLLTKTAIEYFTK